MNSVVLITQSEYARRRGVAKSAVAKAVSERRITLIDGKVDPVVADIQWERNTRARADGGKASTELATPLDLHQIANSQQPPAQALPPSSADEGEYSVNRARRERYEADLAQMKLQEQQGDLVRVVEVRAEIAKRVGQVRMNLLQIPARLAPVLATESDQAKVHAMLDAELRAVLTHVTTAD